MAYSEWDAWMGSSGVPDSSWTFSMPQETDSLVRWNPTLTGDYLSNVMNLSDISRAIGNTSLPAATPALPGTTLVSNPRNNPLLASLGREPGRSEAGDNVPLWKRVGIGTLDLIRKNPAAVLALLGAGGAGIAGAIKGSERAKLPGDVQNLVTRATAPAQPDAYEEAALDRQMRRDLGPGWETSTPGIQAKAYQQYLRQKGDRDAAAQAIAPVGSLYNTQEANRQREQQALFQLAGLLGTLGLGAFKA